MCRATAIGLVLFACMGCGDQPAGGRLGSVGSEGPLVTNGADKLGNGVYAKRPFSYGQAIVYNNSGSELVLRSVKLVRPTAGMRLVRAYALGPHRYFSGRRLNLYGGDEGWPSAHYTVRPLRPAAGHLVRPRHTRLGRWGVELYLKMRVPRLGKFRFRALKVDYTLEGQDYEAILKHAFTACAIRDPRNAGC